MIGYIKLHRQILDSSHFKNAQEQMAFAWLLLRAQWQNVDVRYKGINLSLKRGQLALSYRDFAREWGWSEAKCRRFITKLSETKPKSNRLNSDALMNAVSDAGVCVITILNYNKFQDSLPKSDAPINGPSDGKVTHQRRTSDAQNKEDKKIRSQEGKELSKDSTKKSKGNSNGKRAKRIEAEFGTDWQLPEKYHCYASEQGMHEDGIKSEVQKFFRYWTSPDAKHPTKKDWFRTWQTWIDKSIEWNGNNSGYRNGHGSEPDSILDLTAKIISERDSEFT